MEAYTKNYFSHLDLKPANVMISSAHGWPHVTIVDFDISRTDAAFEPDFLGYTPGYAHPLQRQKLREESAADALTIDIWQLGRIVASLALPTSWGERDWVAYDRSAPAPSNHFSSLAERPFTLPVVMEEALSSTGTSGPRLRQLVSKMIAHPQAQQYRSLKAIIFELERLLPQGFPLAQLYQPRVNAKRRMPAIIWRQKNANQERTHSLLKNSLVYDLTTADFEPSSLAKAKPLVSLYQSGGTWKYFILDPEFLAIGLNHGAELTHNTMFIYQDWTITFDYVGQCLREGEGI